jgi:hypothetical protein
MFHKLFLGNTKQLRVCEMHNFTHITTGTIAVTLKQIWLSNSKDCQCQSRNSPGLYDQVLASSDPVESEGRQMKQS